MDDDRPVGGSVGVDSSSAALLAHWKTVRHRQTAAGQLAFSGSVSTVLISGSSSATGAAPEIAIGFSFLETDGRTDEGAAVLAVRPAWSRMLEAIASDSNALYRLDPRGFEEFLAGAYKEDGWDVILTPRSGDGGKDIIATRADVGAIRILDQAKLYAPGNLVSANDVRAMWGVLDADRRASKAYLTTTSDFAPGVYKEFEERMPTRIELRNGTRLKEWLARIASKD